MTIVIPLLVLCGLGAAIGLLLALADKKLAVETNPLIDEVADILPAGNCANCGYAGCGQYAEAVVEDPEVRPDLCTPGGNEVAQKIAALTGKKAAEIKPVKAVARCKGCPETNSTTKYIYNGLNDCEAAANLFAGEKGCEYGCLGLGNCVRACPFDALVIGELNVPKVNVDNCVGCGLCVTACPRDIMVLVPDNAVSVIGCQNRQKGGQTKKVCNVGCIGCRLCVKACPHDAMKVVDNLCEIDYDKCQFCEDAPCLQVQCKPGVIAPGYGAPIKFLTGKMTELEEKVEPKATEAAPEKAAEAPEAEAPKEEKKEAAEAEA
ncbi:RnfABCDGE type electron transport complex subunit B [Desulfoluna butyratoxydans]|uniref:Ion-translocating oxidoreductase complex subunit B n=1 Tax=Desulfoluna butyratoxydans TaxID=231438 RepID=A0A4U8YRW1_9BACT|nr:Fe-S cluster domain-containing protein [Desulfoluna butyratoxydans]VFQ44013.1 electron transport complex rnfb/rsxb [Desulfoluna butyratoxydans]